MGIGKAHKKGEWIAISKGRSNANHVLVNGTGVSGIPKMGDVGSAAYRRLNNSGTRKHK